MTSYTLKRSNRARYMRLSVFPPAYTGGMGRGRETGVSRVGRQGAERPSENRGFPSEPGGEVRIVLTVPYGTTINTIEKFLANHTDWVEKATRKMRHLKPLPRGRREYTARREVARHFVHERIEYWNSFYHFKHGRIAIKNTKTLWGSCSRKGNLNFSYALIFLPRELADYVIVHELCHLREHNHSARFWALVAHTQPHYKTLRKELRTYILTK